MSAIAKDKFKLLDLDGNRELYTIPISFKKSTGLFYIDLSNTPIKIPLMYNLDDYCKEESYEIYDEAHKRLQKVVRDWNKYVEEVSQQPYLLIYFKFTHPNKTNDSCHYGSRSESHQLSFGLKEVIKLGDRYFQKRYQGNGFYYSEVVQHKQLLNSNYYAVPNTPEAKKFFENMLSSFENMIDMIDDFFKKVGNNEIDYSKEGSLLTLKGDTDNGNR